MKHIKLSVRFIAVSVLIANTMLFVQLFSGAEISKVAALTNIECYQKFDNKATGTGTNGELTPKLLDQYNKSNCPSSKDGNCLLSGSSSGQGSISCSVSKQNQCKADYDGKEITDHESYEESGCGEAEGGPCKLVVQPPKPGLATCGSGQPGNDDTVGDDPSQGSGTSDIGNQYNTDDCAVSPEGLESSNCELVKMIVTITNILSGLAATVIVAMIIIGGIQYSMAGAEAAKVQAAKQKITNALLALLLLIFGFSIIQWLVPGGLV